MAKVKIKKNLSDQDMFAGYQEEVTFEHLAHDGAGAAKPTARSAQKEAPKEEDSFFTPDLQARLNQALLQLKVQMFKKGLLDYQIELSQVENQIILTAVPVNKKASRNQATPRRSK